MAELFGVQRPAITKHLKNIFDSAELDEQVVSSILEHTTAHGAIPGKTQTRTVKYYNLDAIIAAGYRVNSKRATQKKPWPLIKRICKLWKSWRNDCWSKRNHDQRTKPAARLDASLMTVKTP